MKGIDQAPYSEYIQELQNALNVNTEARFAAQQLLTLHKAASLRNDATILELGVDRGQSTKVFLNAIADKNHSHLVSVDIRDCSSVSSCKTWQFVQESSINVNSIIQSAPVLNNGIDILYVDSLHTFEHVRNEVYSWFPYLNRGCSIFFDDIDSGPYMRGQRKDNLYIEQSNRMIHRLILSIFRSNIDLLDLSIMYGSTGLANLTKICDKQICLRDIHSIPERHYNIFTRILNRISFRKSYQHTLCDSDSFLIDVTNFNS